MYVSFHIIFYIYIFNKNFVLSSVDGLEGSPSRRIFNFRMLLRSPSGDPVGWETVHCVGYSDQWTKKISSRKKQGM